jgi:type VI secretion system protein ImpB
MARAAGTSDRLNCLSTRQRQHTEFQTSTTGRLERSMPESVHRKLERVRPPRVHISYEVETGGAIEMKELPFVMGVLGDFSGQPTEPLAKLKDRKFVEINPDNFDEVLKSMKPHLSFKVDNLLSDEPDAGKIGVDLKFESLDDFSPDAVAQQVEPLRKLLDLRQQLADLRGSLHGNDKLEEILQNTMGDADSLAKLKSELDKEGGE